MEGNDGNMWVIIVDSRGVHRWQKYYEAPKKSYLDRVKSSIQAMRILMEDDPSQFDDIKASLDKKIYRLELLEDEDKEIQESIYLLKRFRAESFKFGGQVKMYQKALERSPNRHSQRLIKDKLQKLKMQNV
jgi:hypothetical protein